MGKLGGRELNYSSDIDLVFVYEPDDEDDDAHHRVFHKLARALVQVLTEFTDESYLYRVDLRLRPMGRRGNIAYSLRQHAQYYDTWGETFERFALLKARPLAGDLELGQRFLELVEPFVYRRYLDHAALEEIFRFKQRAEQQEPELDRDVKIGRGGIREIEVFAQVLQLTYGARDRELRQASTLPALDALAARRSDRRRTSATTLVEAYVFLRTLEHRLQIVQEQQTHSLSRAERELDICARRIGLQLGRRARERARAAARPRARSLERALRAPAGSARTTAAASGSACSRTRRRPRRPRLCSPSTGFADAEAALAAVRALDEATALAPSRSMARNVLANLLPALLDRIGRCARPGQVLIRLEQLTERTGAAAAFFRTLLEDEPLRDRLIATLDLGRAGGVAAGALSRAARLADAAAARPARRLRARWQETLGAHRPGEPGRRDPALRGRRRAQDPGPVDRRREAGEGNPRERPTRCARCRSGCRCWPSAPSPPPPSGPRRRPRPSAARARRPHRAPSPTG